MSLESIYQILVGKKVYDGQKWHVYDASDNELSDSLGVLWRANPGALLMWPRESVTQQVTGGWWPDITIPKKKRTAVQEVGHIVKSVAAETVEQAAELQISRLIESLEAAQIKYETWYADLLRIEYDKLLTAEIARYLALDMRKRDEEEIALVLLLAA